MAKLVIPNAALPTVEPVAEPTENFTLSKKKARQYENYAAFKAHVADVKNGIKLRVAAITANEAKQRLKVLKTELNDIQRDLKLFSEGKTNIPKMIESGLKPKAWQSRAESARRYRLFERRLLLIKLDGAK